MSQSAIRVENLSKRYQLGAMEGGRRYQTFREALVQAARAPARRLRSLRGEEPSERMLWALRQVSCEVQPGEVVGIVGRNGAGKSTLLKVLSRITEPTTGRIEIRGRVVSLLEVGTGFHPELTGRENIFLNGAVLGMARREIVAKFDAIVAFSEVERFIDTPVKRYSSGMYLRLAFAVAAHLEPEILLVDEVLAVGDASFQRKCMGKMGEVAGQGRTVLFVSHNMGAVLRLVSRCLLMEQGRIDLSGDARTVIGAYMERNVSLEGEIVYPDDERKAAQIRCLAVRDRRGSPVTVLDPGDDIEIDVGIEVRDTSRGHIDAIVYVANPEGQLLFLFNTRERPETDTRWSSGRYRLEVVFPGGVLNSGRYVVGAGINLGSKIHDNHYGEGLSLELTEASEIGAAGYGMGKKESLLALVGEARLVREPEQAATPAAALSRE